MPPTLTIHDEPLGGQTREAITLSFLTEEVTVRDLIRERVHQEVKDFNRAPKAIFNGLIQPTDSEAKLNGYSMRSKRMIDWEPQYEKAIAAYESNGFLVLVDERQTESLEQRVRVSPRTRVSFLKLVPLIGG